MGRTILFSQEMWTRDINRIGDAIYVMLSSEDRSLSKHALGRKHQSSMSLPVHPVYLFNKSCGKPMLDLKLAPGEPVPPGFEDEVRGVTEIQASLDAYHSGPLIGMFVSVLIDV